MSGFHKLRQPLKRAVDIVGAGVGLVVLAPVMLVLGLTVRIKLGSPVLFAQQRPGKDGQPFTLYKFRSMLPEDQARHMVTDDQRMTTFGKRLRATSLDELPTLFNVLKGDMSLVGPRPLVTAYLPLYSDHQARRHEVRPGITGLAQVSGRNQLSWEERFELDVEYVDRHNILLDITVLARTIGQVFARSGIAGDGISTMTIFVGSPPDDGLHEQLLTEQWQDVLETWMHHPNTVRLGTVGTENRTDTRYWMYLDDQHNAVGIGGLSGLGELHLNARIVMSPDQTDRDVTQAILNRLIHQAKSYDAHAVALRIPPEHPELNQGAERLGFLAHDNAAQNSDPQVFAHDYSLTVAAETRD